MNAAVVLLIVAVAAPIAVMETRRKRRDWRRWSEAYDNIGTAGSGIGHTNGPSQ